MLRGFLMLAAFFGFTGVALGAFAAHGLKNRLTPEYLAIFHTGVTYQLVHTLALLGVALLATQIPGSAGHLGRCLVCHRHPAVFRQPVPVDPDRRQQARHHHAVRRPGIPDRLVLSGLAAWRLAPDTL